MDEIGTPTSAGSASALSPVYPTALYRGVRRRGATIGLVTMRAQSAAATMVSPRTGDTDVGARRMVTLNTSDPDLPALLALDGGARAAIRGNSRVATELFADRLDLYRFPRARLEQI